MVKSPPSEALNRPNPRVLSSRLGDSTPLREVILLPSFRFSAFQLARSAKHSVICGFEIITELDHQRGSGFRESERKLAL